MAKRLYVALISIATILSVNVGCFEPVGQYFTSRAGYVVTINASTATPITCNYDMAELTIYSNGPYKFSFDKIPAVAPLPSDPTIPSGNFFTTGIRYRQGVIGYVKATSGTVLLRLFWSMLGR